MSSFIYHRKMFVRVLFLCLSNLKSKSIQSSKEYIVQFRYNVIKSALQYIFFVLFMGTENTVFVPMSVSSMITRQNMSSLHFSVFYESRTDILVVFSARRVNFSPVLYTWDSAWKCVGIIIYKKKLFLNVICIKLEIYRFG